MFKLLVDAIVNIKAITRTFNSERVSIDFKGYDSNSAQFREPLWCHFSELLHVALGQHQGNSDPRLQDSGSWLDPHYVCVTGGQEEHAGNLEAHELQVFT